MEMETIEQKIERFKRKAEIFFREDSQIFIKDIYDNYHFCKIKEIHSDWLLIQDFKGKREGQVLRLLWLDISDIQEYRERKK